MRSGNYVWSYYFGNQWIRCFEFNHVGYGRPNRASIRLNWSIVANWVRSSGTMLFSIHWLNRWCWRYSHRKSLPDISLTFLCVFVYCDFVYCLNESLACVSAVLIFIFHCLKYFCSEASDSFRLLMMTFEHLAAVHIAVSSA